jgi:hypothetical protein
MYFLIQQSFWSVCGLMVRVPDYRSILSRSVSGKGSSQPREETKELFERKSNGSGK